MTVQWNKSQLCYLSEKVYFVALSFKRKRIIRQLVEITARSRLGLSISLKSYLKYLLGSSFYCFDVNMIIERKSCSGRPMYFLFTDLGNKVLCFLMVDRGPTDYGKSLYVPPFKTSIYWNWFKIIDHILTNCSKCKTHVKASLYLTLTFTRSD